VIGALAALAALGLGDLSDASVAARSLAGFATGGILIVAGVQFWPRAAQPRYRGACFLATSLALWGVHRVVSGAFPAEPGTAPHLMMHLGFMLFYFLSTFAIIIMVLDRARSETATLKEFNERLVDGLGEGLQLVDGDFRIRHANRWMHGLFGPVVGRRCYELPRGRRDAVPGLSPRPPARDRRRGADRGRGIRRPPFLAELPPRCASPTARSSSSSWWPKDRARAAAGAAHEAERLAAAGELAASVAQRDSRNPLAAHRQRHDPARGRRRPSPGRSGPTRWRGQEGGAAASTGSSRTFFVFARPRESKPLEADIRVVVDHVAALNRRITVAPSGCSSRWGSIPP